VRSSRPSTAFVIWERTAEAEVAALERALKAGVVKRGDPVVLGTVAGPGPLPETRWTDALSMSEDELTAAATLPAASTWHGDLRSMSDTEISNALIDMIARPA
jgi:hypothetical protein